MRGEGVSSAEDIACGDVGDLATTGYLRRVRKGQKVELSASLG